MNDSLFASYDTLFCPSVIQTSELQHNSNQQRIVEHDLQASTLYFNSQNDSSHSLQQVTKTAGSSHHQNNVCRTETNLMVAPASSFNNAHNNIPFVQIHTTDVQPQRNNYGNVFRRAATSVAEIKSEPIKSETADNSKDRVNATPTPPVRSGSCNSGERVATPVNNQNGDTINQNGNTISDSVCDPSSATAILDFSIAFQAVRKCSQCRFICVSETALEKHILGAHDTNLFHSSATKQIPCPGCSNIFYSFKSLEIHLVEDHFASLNDAKQIIEAAVNVNSNISGTPDAEEKTTDEPFTQQRKSRIYLKNVECLREPRREPMTLDGPPPHHTDGFFSMNTFNNLERNVELSDILNNDFSDIAGQLHQDKQHSNDVNNSITDTSSLVNSKPKQKISIKSVDVLREPGLLRREYEMQNQFGTLSNVCNDMGFETFGTFQMQSNNEINSIGGNNENNNFNLNSNGENICNNDNNIERPRRPKIYIKNVDILKEPIILPPFASGTTMGLQDPNSNMNYNFLTQSMQQTPTNTDFLNTINNLGVSNQVFDGELPMGGNNIADAYLFENANTNGNGNKANNLLNDIASINTTESYQAYNSGNANVSVNPNLFSYPLINCDNMETTSTTPIMTEPTPPPTTVFNLQNIENVLGDSEENTPVSTPTPTPISIPLSIPTSTPPQQKQKIFIKNVDILKEPQFQEQRERGTLHLRTVDELNLMNRNEVESLIAPNLENNNTNHCGNNTLRINRDQNDNFEHSDELTTLPEDDEMLYEDEALKLQDYATQLVNSWSGDDYDLSEGISCIITDSMEPINNLPTAIPSLSPSSISTGSMPKILHDLETPQMSMISIRDIEELTVPHQATGINCLEQNQTSQNLCELTPLDDHTTIQHDLCTNSMEGEIAKPYVTCTDNISGEKDNNQCNQQQLIVAQSPVSVTTMALTNAVTSPNSNIVIPLATTGTSFNFNLPLEMPPLTPMTNFSHNNRNNSRETSSGSVAVSVGSTIPMPPLVPVSTLVSFPVTTVATNKSNGQSNTQATNTITTNAAISTTTTIAATITTTPPVERGRIYVANNLMQLPSSSSKRDIETTKPQKDTSHSVTGGTSVRGRPFGSNRSDNTVKSNKTRPETNEIVIKCSVRGCAFRFKKPETLTYHKRCHDSNASSSQAKLCPECKSTDFSNWNTLHTHLWRTHQIDMELYSCSQCPFKTPIYSRLINTHTKIHSDERNYKCDQCGKAFKNTKQLKNHRRWHRTHSTSNTTNSTLSSNTINNTTTNDTTIEPMTSSTTATTTAPTTTTATTTVLTATTNIIPTEVHRCSDCNAAFSHLKTLREHSCKKSDHQCSVCGHAASSKSSLKLHMFTHEKSKRLKCATCTYSTSDHNAFRRHKMTHENTKMYTCPHCNYKSIQSVTFQKHVLMKHPDAASTLIHKCKECSYSTVNRTLFAVHQIKHKTSSQTEILLNDPEKSNSSVELIEIEMASTIVDNTNSHFDDNAYLNTIEKNSSNQIKNPSLPIGRQQKIIKVKSDLLIKDKTPRLPEEFISIESESNEMKLKTGTTTLLNSISI